MSYLPYLEGSSRRVQPLVIIGKVTDTDLFLSFLNSLQYGMDLQYSYLVIADDLVCNCTLPAEVRSTLKWGFRLVAKEDADDRASGKFQCTWTVSLEDTQQREFIGALFSLFSGISRARALPQCFQEPGC
uniref:TIR domain-containing protein n=1 Tax=Heterorhabditis bacteriophora TaxID=37862 RepID=A0A1I7WEP7_HETBA